MSRRVHLVRALRRHEAKLRRPRYVVDIGAILRGCELPGPSAAGAHTAFRQQLVQAEAEQFKRFLDLLGIPPGITLSFSNVHRPHLATSGSVLHWCKCWARIHGHDLRLGLVEQSDTALTILFTLSNGEQPDLTLGAELLAAIQPMLPAGQVVEACATSRAHALSPDILPKHLLLAAVLYPDEASTNPILPLYALQDPLAFAHLMPAPSSPVGTVTP